MNWQNQMCLLLLKYQKLFKVGKMENLSKGQFSRQVYGPLQNFKAHVSEGSDVLLIEDSAKGNFPAGEKQSEEKLFFSRQLSQGYAICGERSNGKCVKIPGRTAANLNHVRPRTMNIPIADIRISHEDRSSQTLIARKEVRKTV